MTQTQHPQHTEDVATLVQQMLAPDGIVHGCGCGTTHPPAVSALDTDPARWRRIRGAILNRDRRRCQVSSPTATDPNAVCRAPATDCGHVLARSLGGCDHPSNLRAECKPHNRSDGASLGNALRTVSAALATRPADLTDRDDGVLSGGARKRHVGSPGTELEFAL